MPGTTPEERNKEKERNVERSLLTGLVNGHNRLLIHGSRIYIILQQFVLPSGPNTTKILIEHKYVPNFYNPANQILQTTTKFKVFSNIAYRFSSTVKFRATGFIGTLS